MKREVDEDEETGDEDEEDDCRWVDDDDVEEDDEEEEEKGAEERTSRSPPLKLPEVYVTFVQKIIVSNVFPRASLPAAPLVLAPASRRLPRRVSPARPPEQLKIKTSGRASLQAHSPQLRSDSVVCAPSRSQVI